MKLPDAVKEIRDRYVGKFPVPEIGRESQEEFEQRVREWTGAMASQVAFELPGQGWGLKSRPNNGPISKDGLAQSARTATDWAAQQGQQSIPVTLWDILVSTGSGHPTLSADPESQDVSDQQFVPVAPADRLGAAPPAPPVSVPVFPFRGQAIMHLLAGLHPDLLSGGDDQRRTLSQMIAEQLAFEIDPRFGVKRSGAGRPQGRNTVAYDAVPVRIWIWQDETDRLLLPIAGTAGEPAPGQEFIAVTPQNHLGTAPPVDPPAPPVPPTPLPPGPVPPIDLRLTLAAIQAMTEALGLLQQQVASIQAQVEALANRPPQAPVVPAVKFPKMRGPIFGYEVVLTPDGFKE